MTEKKIIIFALLLSVSSFALSKPPFILISSGEIDIPIKLPEVEEVVSVNNAGDLFNGNNLYPSISSNGRYVAFHTNVSSLDTPNEILYPSSILSNLVVRDRYQDRTFFANKNLDGSFDAVIQSSSTVAFSPDGKFISYGLENGGFIERNITTGVSKLIFSNRVSRIVYSLNGRYILFNSVTGTGNLNIFGRTGVVRYDRQTGYVETMPILQNGRVIQDVRGGSISADGNYVVFSSTDNNITTDDFHQGNDSDVFLWDIAKRTYTLISPGGIGEPASRPHISADGSKVSYITQTNDLVVYDVEESRVLYTIDDLFDRNNTVSLTDITDSGLIMAFDPVRKKDYVHNIFENTRQYLTNNFFSNNFPLPIHDAITAGAIMSNDGRSVAFAYLYEKRIPTDPNTSNKFRVKFAPVPY